METNSKRVRWGVLSTANIGMKRVIPSMQTMRNGDVVAISSRSEAAAKDAAAKLGIPKSYGSYEALLADPDIDAVYNPLPNHLHVPYTILAMEAGKHVLCEKPIAITAPEAEQLLDAQKRFPTVKVMEAFMYRFHPQWTAVFDIIQSGVIGDVRHLYTDFTYYNVDPANVRNKADIGGGALLDIGCYGVNLARWMFAGEPTDVRSVVKRDPVFGTDIWTSVILEFEHGVASILCSTQLENRQSAVIYGTKGSLELNVPYNAADDIERTVTVKIGGTTDVLRFGHSDMYTLQGEAFSQAIIDDAPVPIPITDAIANMKVLDRIID
jgi:predicted dehydrogenase